MDIEAVRRSYAFWAPVYDATFGQITGAGRRRAVALLNRIGGQVLEVGVGTGLSLPLYAAGVEVTGIDASAEMLGKARAKVAELGLARVRLMEMDARRMDFPDARFDAVVAMHILSVVPEPERVMAEMVRVLKPGGDLIVVNHFARPPGQGGLLARAERWAAPLADRIGWHSDFGRGVVEGAGGLHPVEEIDLPPLGMMTLLHLRKG